MDKIKLVWNNKHPTDAHYYINDVIETTKIRMNLADIRYLETSSKYVKIFYEKDKYHLVYKSMNKVLEKLPPTLFLRISQSIAVPIVAIISFDKDQVYLPSELTFKIGKSYKKKVLEFLISREL